MSRANPHLRHFAKRLIVFETKGKKSSGTKIPPAFDVCEKLRPQLTALMGNDGYRALLARALTLARTELPGLRSVHMKADGSLAGLEEFREQLAPDEFLEGRVVLLAQLLGLLVAFIGEKLTLRLMRDVWPRIPLDDLVFEEGDQSKNKTGRPL